MKKDIFYLCQILDLPYPRYSGKEKRFFINPSELSDADKHTLQATLDYHRFNS